MIKSILKVVYTTWLYVLLPLTILVACSNQASSNRNRATLSPGTKTAQASRAIRLATQSAEKVKSIFAVNYADAIATEEALKAYYDERSNWPIILRDTFNDNRNDWPLESAESELASIEWKIANGKYQWDALAEQAFIYWTHPSIPTFSDFFLTVEAQQTEGLDDGQFGLAFRILDEKNYYLFMIDQNMTYNVQLYNEGQWFTITYTTPSTTIEPQSVNRISVIGEGSRFRFYINDFYITEVSDDTLSTGKFGVAIGLSYPQAQASFEFYNFELRTPEEITGSQ